MDDRELKILIADLHREHGALVLRRCQSLLKDDVAADDAAQEAFIRVIENIDRFRGEASPMTWIYRIATNVCLDELRRRARRATVELTPELQDALTGSQASAENMVLSQEQLSRLFARTDPTSLQILVHTYLDEMTQEETADVMGLSRKTVWSKLQRLKQHIQRGRR
ncbi:MAG: sigma-70 family RNA polymerase sigma factor [Deltaproteobacteria bacterium]|nr:sigma-70 family RNA polymerase sigma factor [Deltaproteobacteria bacterium]